MKRNVLNVDFHIENYSKIISKLRGEIETLRDQLKAGAQPTSFPDRDSELANT